MLTSIHHLGLTVRDVEASARWYADVLGFRRIGEFVSPDGGWRKVFLSHDELSTRISLAEHREGGPDPFDETRVGLDHLAFGVSDRGELDAWAARLAAASVVHSPIAASNVVAWCRGARVPRPGHSSWSSTAPERPPSVTKGSLTPVATSG